LRRNGALPGQIAAVGGHRRQRTLAGASLHQGRACWRLGARKKTGVKSLPALARLALAAAPDGDDNLTLSFDGVVRLV